MMALAAWLDARRLLWCHTPNESPVSVAYRVKMKRLGVKAGCPDVLIFSHVPRYRDLITVPVRGVALELKALGGRVSPAQKAWLAALREEGWLTRVCVGAIEAVEWLQSLGY